MNKFSWPVRVYYEDTDGGGVVYHANYLRFMERARTEWLRSLGFGQHVLRHEHGILFVVREIKVRYVRPAVFDDALEVISELEEVRHSLMRFKQIIRRQDEVLTEGVVDVVCVDANKFKPVAMPPAIKEKMTEFA
jgi:acyl-CoA thioester hydrolase